MDTINILTWLCKAEYRNKDNQAKQAKYGKGKEKGFHPSNQYF
jgi:hypothetical protein